MPPVEHEPWMQGVEKIRKEYQRLDIQWLHLQYETNLWIVFLAATGELILFFLFYAGELMSRAALSYAVQYVLLPFGINMALLLSSHYIEAGKRFKNTTRIYGVSIITSLCCFVIYTAHGNFSALYLILAVPMFFTIIYADIRLTRVVFLACIVEKAVSDLLIPWAREQRIFSDRLSTINFFLSLAILTSLFVICVVMIRIEKEKNNFSIGLEREREKIQAQAVTDPLTGIGNRQALREAFDDLKHSTRRRCILAMMDMDNFKDLNDQHGHSYGDWHLAALGQVLQQLCSEQISAYRFGGDEFCVLFRDGIPSSVLKTCRSIQTEFMERQKSLEVENFTTLSIGIAEYRFGEPPSVLLERADAALYQAKEQRNSEEQGGRVCYADK